MNLTEIFRKITNPVLKYRTSFVFLTFILWVPEVFSTDYVLFLKFLVVGLLGNEFISSSLVYLLCCFAYVLSKKNDKLGVITIILSHLIVYAFFFVELFLFLFFDSHINANILQIIEETNGQESSEFLQTYLLSGKFVFICCVTLFLFGLEFFIHKKIKGIQIKKNRAFSLLAVGIIASVGFLFYNASFLSFNFVEDWKRTEGMCFRRTSLFNVYESFSQFLQERESFYRCAQSNENVRSVLLESDKKNIVVIIGESFNKYHSNLYGYDLQTNPKLVSLANLYIFDDVISPINATSNSFKNFLSFSSIDDDRDWSESALFPAVFKTAGYNVVFLSNQFISEVNMNTYDASCGFFNHPSVAPKLFSFRNSEKYQYDGDLLNFYKTNRSSIESDSLNLIIFHLYGQHVKYSSRFPKGNSHFTVADYNYRKELSNSQRQDVADYDNATLYNDSIVYEIMTMFDSTSSVVVYFADHGDEVNDFRPHVGRSRNLDVIGAPGLHCQLDIPLMIHFSNSYAEKHPDEINRVKKSLHKPFIIDDLPHVLIDLAKIDFDLFQPTRSLINSSFNDKRKRIVRPLASSSIDYDSVCSKYGNWKIGY